MINSWVVSLIRFRAGIIDCADEELKALDRKTREKLTMYGALHPNSDVHRLYFTRKNEREDLKGGGVNIKGVKDESTLRKVNKENHQRQWHEKVLHGQVYKSTKG